MGATLLAARSFADHHRYRDADLAGLAEAAAGAGALLVTTEKDHVRLPAAYREHVTVLPITVAWQEPTAPDRLLDLALRGVAGA